MSNMIVSLILRGDGSRWDSTLRRSEGRLKNFGGTVRREFQNIRNAAGTLQGKLATLGISVGAMFLIKQSAELDKGLTRIGQTAGASRAQVAALRQEFFRMGIETGAKIEDLKAGFDNAVQAGLNFREALPVTDAVNKAMAVTGASADQLTSGLTVASTAFDFDLARPGKAILLLDKMTVAGRQGNAELENLSSIFARVGVNSSRAGMGFDQTLGFIEGLSLLERNPERLATLADSTLRLFTNLQYLQRAQKATGVKFFDDQGGRRDPLAVLGDIKQKYDLLKTDQEKEGFMGKAFKGADLDTIKGLQALLKGDMLQKIAEMNRKIGEGGGTIKKDLADGINNAIDQTGRLKNALRDAADGFIQPINKGVSWLIRKMLDSRKDGGMEMSGPKMIGYGAVAGAGIMALMAYLKGKAMGKVKDVLTGGGPLGGFKGPVPVYVVNKRMSLIDPSGGGNIPGASLPGKAGKAVGVLGKASMIGTSAIMGYEVGGIINNTIGKATGRGEGWLGDMLYDFLHKAENPEVKNDIKLNITVDQSGRVVTNNANRNTTVAANVNRGAFFK